MIVVRISIHSHPWIVINCSPLSFNPSRRRPMVYVTCLHRRHHNISYTVWYMAYPSFLSIPQQCRPWYLLPILINAEPGISSLAPWSPKEWALASSPRPNVSTRAGPGVPSLAPYSWIRISCGILSPPNYFKQNEPCLLVSGPNTTEPGIFSTDGRPYFLPIPLIADYRKKTANYH